jgi:hypothetical protein
MIHAMSSQDLTTLKLMLTEPMRQYSIGWESGQEAGGHRIIAMSDPHLHISFQRRLRLHQLNSQALSLRW